MSLITGIFVLVIACGPSAYADESEIEGRWRLDQTRQAGRSKGNGYSFIFKNGVRAGGMFGFVGQERYVIRPDKVPKEIDFIKQDGRKQLGIYQVSKVFLTIVLGSDQRPNRFTDPDPTWVTYRYQRDEERVDPDTPRLKGKWKVVGQENSPIPALKSVAFGSHGEYENDVRGSLLGPTGRPGTKRRPPLGSLEVRLDSTVDPNAVKATYRDSRGRQRRTAYLTGTYLLANDKLVFFFQPRSVQPGIVGPLPSTPAWQLRLERDKGD